MKFLLFLYIPLLLISTSSLSQQNTPSSKDYFTIEGYYKVKWGHADEFIGLWKANHYPLLKKAMEKGDIISITASKPRYHSSEETRWDFRVTIVFKTVALAFDENLTEPYKKELYPDQESYKKAEQYRFEILLAHWDIETTSEALQ
jgi:hypothetical protein